MVVRPHFFAAILAAATLLISSHSYAGIITFFDASQSNVFTSGTTSETLTSQGYKFTYTRDKLFTGGTGQIIGRPILSTWPDGLHAQFVTTGASAPANASVTISRVDGAVFDILDFTCQLYANAGAGRAFEVVPKLLGEEPLNDPIQFDCSGSTFSTWSYSRTPNIRNESTIPLTGYDSYTIGLTLDYGLLGITVQSAAPDPIPEPASFSILAALALLLLRRKTVPIG